jgi:hypothetical protein
MIHQLTVITALVTALAVACNSPGAQRDHGGSMTKTTVPTPAASSGTPSLRWTTHSPAPGLTFALLDGAPTSVEGDARAGRIISGHRPVRVGLWYGPDAGLAAWREGVSANPGAVAGPESAVTVCGQPGRRVEVSTPTRPGTHISDGAGGRAVEPNPGETFVAVELRHRGVTVVAYYVVETAQRIAFAADEAHFFAAITCE